MFDSPDAFDGFVAEFAAGRLGKARWTHAAHLAVGLWYLERLGFAGALEAMRAAIRRHNEAVGTPNTDDGGYHETLTRLYLTAIAAQRRAHRAVPLPQALRQLLASPLADSRWPLTYYSRARLFSVDARHAWVAPDLRAL
ncbi:MAG: hypothetical protein JSR36_13855 [Proteobacteria bacterium]|nr:hypothetical protein [Pseudomonadota bacterium]